MAESELKDPTVCLNIGGQRFVTYASTLSRAPETRLAKISKSDSNYNHERDEFFFDHNPCLFPYILDAIREGSFHFPRCVCAPTVRQELQYWGLTDGTIPDCCWKPCAEWEDEQKTMAIIDNVYGWENEQLEENEGKCSMHRLWLFLDEPRSSTMAKVWSFVHIALLALSVLLLTFSTIPEMMVYHHTEAYNNEHPVLVHMKTILFVFFLIELIVRFIVCPKKSFFFCTFFNILDIIAIIPMAALSILSSHSHGFGDRPLLRSIYNIASIVAMFRMVRILKQVRLSRNLQEVMLAIRASLRELLLPCLLIAIVLPVLSATMFYAEMDANVGVESIVTCMWWCVVTITTVGYGDIVPYTPIGKMVAVVCAICGVFLIGLPVAIMAKNFRRFAIFVALKARLDRRRLDGKLLDRRLHEMPAKSMEEIA